MSESLTDDDAVNTGLETQPTGQEEQQHTEAESSNQEAISTEQSQEAASTDTATNTKNGGATEDDNSLAKFAKSQGYTDEDIESLSDREKKLLKIASDNQKAFRNNTNGPKVAETAKELNAAPADADVATKAVSEINQFRYEQKTNEFWSNDKRDKSIEPLMVEILNEKKAALGKEYAQGLSNDLETLYAMAQIRAGQTSSSSVNEEAIRQEERDSINRKQSASAPDAHAVSQASSTVKIDSDWVENVYDPSNEEHVKMLQEAMAAQRSSQY